MNSTEKVVVPLLIVQTASVALIWSLDTLTLVSQKIFLLFLAADFLAFGLMAHLYVNSKIGGTTKGTTIAIWWVGILILFGAAFVIS